MDQPRAELYAVLAEVLSSPPSWLCLPGKEWPLYRVAASTSPVSTAARAARTGLSAIAAEPAEVRRRRYTALFSRMGPGGKPGIWLYESLHYNGRLFGPQAVAVERLYRATGLKVGDEELPDHASVELAFLSYLAGRQVEDARYEQRWRRMERLFLRKHAGRWLPDVGRQIAATGDPVYAPIGRLLTDFILEGLAPPSRKVRACRRPQVQPEKCTLCGFCVQACPFRALKIGEDSQETTLSLSGDRCTGCGQCARTCYTGALEMAPATTNVEARRGTWVTLRRSPRLCCRRCGNPTVSLAEHEFVSREIGPAPWLDYCLDCRGR